MKKKKLTKEQIEELKKAMDKIIESDKKLGVESKMFLDSIREVVSEQIANFELPNNLVIYLLQREFLLLTKQLSPKKDFRHGVIIVNEAIADTLKDEIYLFNTKYKNSSTIH